jgi:hypothetical protein
MAAQSQMRASHNTILAGALTLLFAASASCLAR